MKKLIKDQEDDLIKKLCSNEKIDTYKKAVSDKFGEVDSKLTLLDRRGSALEVSEKITKLLQELEEKLFSLQREDVMELIYSKFYLMPIYIFRQILKIQFKIWE